MELSKIENAVEQAGYSVVYEKLKLNVSGITDSSDAQNLEKKLAVEGIKDVSVNYGNSTILVQYNPVLLSISDIRGLVAKSGYVVISEDILDSAEELEAKRLKKLLFIGIALTTPVLIFGYPEIFSSVPF
ncbi:MAG: heavy-metal-associated domain-containing protein, partial [Burkholderiaceae bacterium]|nr:heavy-metal-associated domain-containing protein [Burkholderiaceae bacterium]